MFCIAVTGRDHTVVSTIAAVVVAGMVAVGVEIIATV